MADQSMESRFQFILRPPFIIAAALLIAIIVTIVAYFYIHQSPTSQYVAVVQGSITQEVTATGTVKPTESVDLGFEHSGTIASIPVVVGEAVVQGQTLATLQNADLAAQSEQAQANLQAAQAQLASLQAGTRSQVLATDRAAVAQAIQAAYLVADDAVHNRVDAFFTNPRSNTPSLDFSLSNSQLQSNLLSERVAVEVPIASLQSLVPQGDVSSTNGLVPIAAQAGEQLVSILQFLDTANSALAQAIPSTSVTSANIAAWQTSVAGGRSEVSDALQALTASQGILSIAEAGSSSQDIQAQQAAVASAQAALDLANANLTESVIRAPISGTITQQNGNGGQVVSPGETFLSLQSNALFEIDAYVSEADVGKLAVGNAVQVNLDAYPGSTFTATIVAIDPSATVENGVSSYKVTAQFTTNDPRIKAGLTANLTIVVGTATQALLVPISAIITEATSTYVLRQAGSTQTLVPVVVGIENVDGQAQILSGLSLGDYVASFGDSAAAGGSASSQ